MLLICSTLSVWLIGQKPTEPFGLIATARAGATATVDGLACAWDNPAGLIALSSWGGTVYAEYPFGLKALQRGGLALAWGNQRIGLAATAKLSGTKDYRGQQFALKVGQKLSPKLSLGLGAIYADTKVREGTRKAQALFEVGILARPSQHWRAAATLSKGFALGAPENTGQPWFVRTGVSWWPSPQASISFDTWASPGEPLAFRAGAFWQPVSSLSIDLGLSARPLSAALGLRYRLGKIGFGSATAWHPDLGFSPAVEATFGP